MPQHNPKATKLGKKEWNKTIKIIINPVYSHRFERRFLKAFKSIYGRPPKGFSIAFAEKTPEVTVEAPDEPEGCNREIVWESGAPEPDTIICGFSGESGLTFSSLKKNRLVICLNSALDSLYGARVEPQEICVRGCVGDAYPILAAAAVKFLLEKPQK